MTTQSAKSRHSVTTIDALGRVTVRYFHWIDAAEAYVAEWQFDGLTHTIEAL